jgi:hypothetical protein
MAVRRAPENGVHRADPGEGLAAELDESAEPLVWVRERADLVPAVGLVALRGILRVGPGQRQDAFQQARQTIATFGDRLRQQVDLDTLTGELLAAVNQTMQPTQVSLWLRP